MSTRRNARRSGKDCGIDGAMAVANAGRCGGRERGISCPDATEARRTKKRKAEDGAARGDSVPSREHAEADDLDSCGVLVICEDDDEEYETKEQDGREAKGEPKDKTETGTGTGTKTEMDGANPKDLVIESGRRAASALWPDSFFSDAMAREGRIPSAAFSSFGLDSRSDATNPAVGGASAVWPPCKRRKHTAEQTRYLEERFVANPLPCSDEKIRIAMRIGTDIRKVNVWYQNKRARQRRDEALRASSVPPGIADALLTRVIRESRKTFRTTIAHETAAHPGGGNVSRGGEGPVGADADAHGELEPRR